MRMKKANKKKNKTTISIYESIKNLTAHRFGF